MPGLVYFLTLCLHLSRLFQDATLLCGKRGQPGGGLKALVVGDEESVLYAASFLFHGRPHRLRLGKVFIYGIGFRFSWLFDRIDLIFARTAPVWPSYWRNRGYFLLPKWVNFTCSTRNASDEFLKTRRNLKRNVNTAFKKGFSYELINDRARVALFHRNIYHPYISERYKDLAQTQSLETALYYSGRGGLLLVRQAGEDAAGALCVPLRSKFLILMAALDPAFIEHAENRRIAMTALYYFTLRHAEEAGYTQVDFGGCLPFFNDGVFHFKRKWGMQVCRQALAPQEYAVKTLRLNKATRGLLADSPFVFRDGQHLRGMAFIDLPQPATADEVLTCYKKYWTGGLKTLRIASFSGYCEAAAKELAEARNLELVSAGSHEALTGTGRRS